MTQSVGEWLGDRLGYNSLWLYLILVVPAMILSVIAQVWVKSSFNKMSSLYSKSGYSGAYAAAQVLRFYGITDVRVEQCSGNLTDHYDPKDNVIRLSENVYSSTSVAAIGIACHEAGHAAQYANSYLPIKVRNVILPLTKIGSYAGIPLAMLGLLVGFDPLVSVGLLLYSCIMLFQLATLPIELNASRRALQVIDSLNMLTRDEEYRGAKRVLTAAAMTYIAALAVSLGNLLRLLILFSGRRRN
ncbi:MAG: zinc metallopeptidase [Clostridia bacterium]|nr:zinc metallopeptidase [Clostridia bacterium]